MKLYGGIRVGKRNKDSNFGGNPDHDPGLVEIYILQVLFRRLWK